MSQYFLSLFVLGFAVLHLLNLTVVQRKIPYRLFSSGLSFIVIAGVFGSIKEQTVPFSSSMDQWRLAATWVLAIAVWVYKRYQVSWLSKQMTYASILTCAASFISMTPGHVWFDKTWTHIIFVFHIFALMGSMAATTLSVLTVFAYWIEQLRLKKKKLTELRPYLNSLEQADGIINLSISLGWVCVSVAVFSGLYLAHYVWNSNWIHEPKLWLGLITWAWLCFVALFRRSKHVGGKRLLVIVSIGMLLLFATYIVTLVISV